MTILYQVYAISVILAGVFLILLPRIVSHLDGWDSLSSRVVYISCMTGMCLCTLGVIGLILWSGGK